MRKLLYMYLVYVIYFLGVGMVSSGIVLMPFNPVRYSLILGIGLLLFSSGSFINEFVIEKKELHVSKVIRLIIVSLTLAIGIGMISGGISHFKESPVYVSYLIPLGLIISFISYTVKNGYVFEKKQHSLLIAGVVMIGLVLHLSLSMMASSYQGSGKGGHGGDIFMNMDMDMEGHGK